jgi:hypothetical protein
MIEVDDDGSPRTVWWTGRGGGGGAKGGSIGVNLLKVGAVGVR